MPIVGVGGVVIQGKQVLLIRRAKPPLKGRWTIPGGMLEIGETLSNAVRRELKEETGLDVEPCQVIAVLDRIIKRGRRVRFHYVIVDYACRVKRGELHPASDVLDARWVRRAKLVEYRLSPTALAVIQRAFDLFAARKLS